MNVGILWRSWSIWSAVSEKR